MWQGVPICDLLSKISFEENCPCSSLKEILNLICRWLSLKAEILDKSYSCILKILPISLLSACFQKLASPVMREGEVWVDCVNIRVLVWAFLSSARED